MKLRFIKTYGNDHRYFNVNISIIIIIKNIYKRIFKNNQIIKCIVYMNVIIVIKYSLNIN